MTIDEKKKLFLVLYEKEADALFRFCLFRLSEREQSLDIVQEAFMRVWRSISNDKKMPNSRAYLFLVARNLIIDWYRKKKPESLDSLMDWNNEGELTEAIYEPGDPLAHVHMGLGAEAAVALSGLTKIAPQYSEVIYLRFVEGLEPQQIAEVLETNANTISIRLTRGIEALRKVLKIEK